jgi:hypothetical protein
LSKKWQFFNLAQNKNRSIGFSEIDKLKKEKKNSLMTNDLQTF